jgi:ParB/RepB/Spo0J family partition protein
MTTGRAEPLVTRKVLLGLIDEPDLPTREKMDPVKLRELSDSLARDGQFQSIGLEQRGARFVIIFGHRRFVAAKMGAVPELRADIYPEGVDHALVMQAGENAYREKVNPAEEGEWLKELYLTRCGEDLERLCALVGLPEDYVSKRLVVAMGDPKVKAAVRDKQIGFGVALELNRIKRDDHRAYYLSSAVTNGATDKLARFWRSQSEIMTAQDAAPPPTEMPAGGAVESAPATNHFCICCGGTDDVGEMMYVLVHKFCEKAILAPAREQRQAVKA